MAVVAAAVVVMGPMTLLVRALGLEPWLFRQQLVGHLEPYLSLGVWLYYLVAVVAAAVVEVDQYQMK